jgi:hypothetical protein
VSRLWRILPVLLAVPLAGQTMRPGIAAGMGVTYRSAADIVALVNSTQSALERVGEFRAGAEFFAAFSMPLDESWVLKMDYAYQIASMNVATQLETAQFTITQHCPTLVLQYVLHHEETYNVKAGAGAGYHFGRLAEKFFTIDNTYSAHGPALLVELEGNTAFGEHLYATLGLSAGWSLLGALKDDAGRAPGFQSTGESVTMNSFGVGVRLGFMYYIN